MAVFMGNDVQVLVNSVDLTDHVTEVRFTEETESLTTTAMGDSNVTRIGGIADGSVDIEFLNDFAASKVYATVSPLIGQAFPVVVTPTSASVSATNPKKTVTVIGTEVPFIDGIVTDLATVRVSWPFSGAVVTATS